MVCVPSRLEEGTEIPDGPNLMIRLFGRFESQVNGAPVGTIHSRHEHLLLALLTLAHGTALPRPLIAERLWPADEQSSFRIDSNFRRTLKNLRKSLGPAADRLPEPRSMARTLSLDLTGADVDLIRFDGLVSRQDPEDLEEAVRLYRGALLMEYSENHILERQPSWLWILEERRKRQQAFRKAVTELSVHAQVLGDYALAAERLRLAIEADPLWQPGYRLRMEALVKIGQRQEALVTYDRLCRLLRRENRDGPGADIVALHEKIRRPPRTPRPAKKKQPTAAPLTGNLPRTPTSFIERGNDVVQIIAYLQSQRLVTLTGTGGVGKTRLSLRVAQELTGSFPDSLWFIDLASLNPGADAGRVSGAAGDVFRPLLVLRESEPLKSLTEFLSDKTALLLFDNCEHVVEATRLVVTTLLQSCPGVRILATSRQPLGIPGEIRWHVPSLLTPDPRRLSFGSAQFEEFLRAYPAVTLFAERAAAARPGFAISPDNVHTVAEICYRLDGIPLAIELATARLQSVGLTDLVTAVDDLFAPDLPGNRLPKERQRTLRCLIDWSYDLLHDSERNLLMRLAVFRGGWTMESAAAVCADPALPERQVRALLTQLVEKSLAAFDEPNGVGRYRLLETIRQYAGERLADSGEYAIWKARHLAYFASLAECAEPKLRGEEQKQWYLRLETENENLRSALEYCFETPGGNEIPATVRANGLNLAGALWHFWEMRSASAEGYKWLRAALHRTDSPGIARARALLVSAILADDFCEGSLMLPQVEEGVALARSLGNQWWTGFGLLVQGWMYRPIDMSRTMEYVTDALTVAREVRDPWLIAFACHVTGYQEVELKNFGVARQLFLEALGHVRRARDMWLLEEAVYHLGLAACAEGAEEEALRHLNECLKLQNDLGTRTRSATARYYKGSIHFRRGESDMAQALFRESLRRAEEFGTRRTMTGALRGLASLAAANGQPERAAVLFGAAAGLRETLDTPLLPIGDAAFDAQELAAQAAVESDIYAVLAARGQMMPLDRVMAFALE